MDTKPTRSEFLELLQKARRPFSALGGSREKSIIERHFDDIELWTTRVPDWRNEPGAPLP